MKLRLETLDSANRHRDPTRPRRGASAGCRRWIPLLALAALISPDPCAGASQPRPLSELEREAVRLAAVYCSEGSAAWFDRLSEDSKLRRLGRETLAAELEVRLGVGCEATWELQTVTEAWADRYVVFGLEFPSGLDDALILELEAAGGGPARLVSVRTLAESPVRELAGVGTAPVGSANGSVPLLGAAAAFAITALLAAALQGRAPGRRRLLLATGGSLALLAASACGGGAGETGEAALPDPAPEASVAKAEFLSLAPLADLRRAGITRTDAALAGFGGPEPEDPRLQAVSRLWRAQQALLAGEPKTASELLAGVVHTTAPLAALLRARLAFLDKDEIGVAVGYELALERVPTYDGLLYEAAQVLGFLGFADRSERQALTLSDMGSRHGGVYYSLAQEALVDRRIEEADRLFQIAVALEPRRRSELLEEPILSLLLEPDRDVFHLLRLDRPEDTRVRHRETGRRPLELPDGVGARLMGGLLRLEIGEQGRILVPGGAALAPRDTPVDAAGSWSREQAERVLARLPELMAECRLPGALAQGHLRRQLAIAAEALADQNRWQDLIELTDPFGRQVEHIDTDVLRLRALALQQSGRMDSAIRLLAEVALHARASRRLDPVTLLELSDLLAKQGQFEAAIKLANRANNQLPMPMADVHIQRLQMERNLAAEFETVRSEHFAIRHPPGSVEVARRMSRVLEAERERLKLWIPVTGDSKIEVHLLSFGDFSRRYGGGVEVLGIFDGRVRLPLADVPWFPPFVVELMTHELAHAMIAEYTHNQAPKWLHEGLAQHVEMVGTRINPIADYLERDQFLSFPAVEASLRGFPNARLVATAYDEAVWIFHYIESKHGAKAIKRLLDAYRDGATTEQALDRVFGMSVVAFDAVLRDWWLNEAPNVWRTPVHEYELDYGDRLVRRTGEIDPDFLQVKWWQQ